MAATSTKVILGIDEVGRGPWAGPLVIGAVVLGDEFQDPDASAIAETPEIDIDITAKSSEDNPAIAEKSILYQNLADSKQLSAKKRTTLAPLIYQHAAAAATGWVSARELDTYGLSASLKLATRRAVQQILAQNIPFTEIIIDGTVNFLKGTPLANRVTMLKKADSLVKAVSAASIIAKVARDTYMIELAAKYPEYGFDRHVGYGTKAHRAALEKHGICPEHRLSFRPIATFVKPYSDRTMNSDHPENTSKPSKTTNSPKNTLDHTSKNRPNAQIGTLQAESTTSKGQHAENLVADYLKSLGHIIIAHNFKTKTYEIDLISIKDDQIYFTEVKYRKNHYHGSALSQITPAKHRQMHYAAEKFLSIQPNCSTYQPLLAVAAVSGEEYEIEDWFVI